MMLKKLVSYFLLPYPGALALALGGLVLLWFTTRQRTGKVLVSAGVALLLVCSSGASASWYMSPLTRYVPLSSLAAAPGVRWIVVLGSGYSDLQGIPATSRLGGQSLQRLVEAVRLYRTAPGAKLVVSGGVYQSRISQAEVMEQAAQMLGVPAADIVREDESDDTQDEARLIHGIVGGDRFVLVTSPMHMRRSMRLFEKQGMQPIAAPAGYYPEHSSVLPNTGQLGTAEAAEHEYLGLLWSRLRGTI